MKQIIRLVLLFLIMISTVDAEYVPSGKRTWYNAEVDSTRTHGGGPVRNYFDGVWRTSQVNFRVEDGFLICDSSEHQTAIRISDKKILFKKQGHILGLEVGNLYALRWSTKEQTLLAEPNFLNNSFSDNVVKFFDVYPGVDLIITNELDNLVHRFIFSPTARASIRNWWNNNGQHDDIYIVNTFNLDVSNLNLDIRDAVKVVDILLDIDLDGGLRFMKNGVRLFSTTSGYVEPHISDDYTLLPLKKALIRMNNNTYYAEGFKLNETFAWDETKAMSHNATLGNTNAEATGLVISNVGADPNMRGNPYTSGSAGTMDSAYIQARNNFNGNDTVKVVVYDDTGGDYPDNLIGNSDTLFVTSGSATWWVATISGNISASTVYWLFMRNISIGGNVRLQAVNNSFRELTQADPQPVDDPFAVGATSSNTWQFSMYIVYTESGGAEPTPARRRKMNNLRGEYNEKNIIYTYMPTDNK